MIRRSRVLIAGGASLVLAATVAFAALSGPRTSPRVASIPSRLDDSDFWALSARLSEPGGYFRSDNFVSNEGELQYVIPELLEGVPRGRPYVGVGPEQNFTYIVALEPQVAFIVDIRRQNLVLHLMYKALMELSSDRATFVSRLLSRRVPPDLETDASVTELFARFAESPPDTLLFWTTLDALRKHLMDTHGFPLDGQDRESLFYVFASFAEGGADLSYSFGQMGGQRFGRWMPTLAEMMTETDGRGVSRSYLASEASYATVRDLQQRNLIIPVVGDYGNGAALRGVAEWLRGYDATLGAFYASNVEQYLYMQENAAPSFFASLAVFPRDEKTRFIRGVSNRGWLAVQNPRSRLAQRAVSLEQMLRLVREGRAKTYWDLVVGLER